MEDQVYTNVHDAQAALDAGEKIRIAVQPFAVDPALLQLALDLQMKERFDEWKRGESQVGQEHGKPLL